MKLFYRVYGEGKPIIILHGLFGMSDNWIPIAKQLAGKHKVYLLDMRNHGQSPHSIIHDYKSMSEDVLEFLNDTKIKKATLIGHSMGGKAVLQFAVDYAKKVEQLIIADISPKAYINSQDFKRKVNNHQELLKSMKQVDLENFKDRSEVRAYFNEYFQDDFIHQLIQKNIKKNNQSQFIWKINVDVLYKSLDDIKNEVPLSNEFRFIKTLFVFGSNSPYFRNEDKVYIQTKLPFAQIKSIEGAGHMLHIENGKKFVEIVSAFMN